MIDTTGLPEFTMAFQPIVSLGPTPTIFAYEALVRGPDAAPAGSVFSKTPKGRHHDLDAACRLRAIDMAKALDIDCYVSINVLPQAICHADLGLMNTLDHAHAIDFPTDRIIFEITEMEAISDFSAVNDCLKTCRDAGAMISLDDFGAGFNGLNTLLELKPDMIKLDMKLVSKIEDDRLRREMVTCIRKLCEAVNIQLIAEGVETARVANILAALGITHMQGYYFGRPEVERAPTIAVSRAAIG